LSAPRCLNAGCAWNLYNKPGIYDEVALLHHLRDHPGGRFRCYREPMGSRPPHPVRDHDRQPGSPRRAVGSPSGRPTVVPMQIVSGLFDTINDLMLTARALPVAP
jgi:hypothetical protein